MNISDYASELYNNWKLNLHNKNIIVLILIDLKDQNVALIENEISKQFGF